MSAFNKMGRLVFLSIFTSLILFALFYYFFRKQNKTARIKENTQLKYQKNVRILHKQLFEIYNLTANGKINEAENTFLDMRQLWFMQDVLVKSSKGQISMLKYFPSDSLNKLEKLISLMQEKKSSKEFIPVAREIRRIEERLDESQIKDK